MARAADRSNQLVAALEEAGRPISGEDLGRRVGISARSVREYVRTINRRAGAPVIVASHRGYELAPDARSRLDERDALTGDPGGSRGRSMIVIEALLSNGDSGDVFALCDRLHVSLSTLELDLVRVRRFLKKYGLTLERHRNEVRIQGEEANKRQLFRRVLWSSVISAQTGFADLAAIRPERDLVGLRQLLAEALTEEGLQADEFALDDMAVHLSVVIARSRANRHLYAAAETLLPPVAEKLADAVGRRAEISFDLAERQHLADLLEANAQPLTPDPSRVVPEEVRRAVERALAEVADEFQMDRAGREMVDSLVLHVNALRLRARTGAFVHNPLSRPFKESQPLLHELAVQFSRKLGASLSIEIGESEVGFLAFYLAHHLRPDLDEGRVTVQVVVPRYAPLLTGLLSAVEEAVGSNGIVGPPLTSDELRADAIGSDVVVTCVHLSPIAGVRTVRVSPVPTEADRRAIADAVAASAEQRRRRQVWSVLAELIRPDHYFSDAAWNTKEEVIEALSGVLIRGGYAPDWFTSDVLERERLSSTAFRDQFAIPHGLQMSAYRTGIAVYVSPRPIPWGDSTVQLVMLFAFEPEERKVFHDVFNTLTGFLSSRQSTASLIAEGGTHAKFMACLEGLLHATDR